MPLFGEKNIVKRNDESKFEDLASDRKNNELFRSHCRILLLCVSCQFKLISFRESMVLYLNLYVVWLKYIETEVLNELNFKIWNLEQHVCTAE